jgi:hypothetical protein
VNDEARAKLRAALPSCRHGVPVRDHCAECSPEPKSVTSLLGDLAKIEPKFDLRPGPLNLPDRGRHVAAVTISGGVAILRCKGCGSTVARIGSQTRAVMGTHGQGQGGVGPGRPKLDTKRTRDRDRMVEEAWGQHRNLP